MLLYLVSNKAIIITAKELNIVPNIRPVSDLRNYTDVLKDIAVGELNTAHILSHLRRYYLSQLYRYNLSQ